MCLHKLYIIAHDSCTILRNFNTISLKVIVCTSNSNNQRHKNPIKPFYVLLQWPRLKRKTYSLAKYTLLEKLLNLFASQQAQTSINLKKSIDQTTMLLSVWSLILELAWIEALNTQTHTFSHTTHTVLHCLLKYSQARSRECVHIRLIKNSSTLAEIKYESKQGLPYQCEQKQLSQNWLTFSHPHQNADQTADTHTHSHTDSSKYLYTQRWEWAYL